MYTISFDRLTKRYGPVLAVDGLSFDAGPGRVTGSSGPTGPAS
jgi:ABC-2 type transport system ATP-binding protein